MITYQSGFEICELKLNHIQNICLSSSKCYRDIINTSFLMIIYILAK